MDELAADLADAGGLAAPRERGGRLRTLLSAELRRGRDELARPRSGYGGPAGAGRAATGTPGGPVTVAVAPADGALVAVVPVAPDLRADPAAVTERGWLLTAATVGSLVEAGAAGDPLAGRWEGALALRAGGARSTGDAELATLAFEEQVQGIDRLRARALAVPTHLLADAADLRPPIGRAHPLAVAALVARLGGRPADPGASEEHEDAVLALLAAADGADTGAARPHDDPDPSRRAARRILQRLDGMGKWGGYHTEFAHLARGFAGNDRRLAERVGEALLDAGLLAEKPSVGQRHVFLNPRRAGAIRALIDDGEVPDDLRLP